jgi:hypothetical protein
MWIFICRLKAVDVVCCFTWLFNMMASFMSSMELQLMTSCNWFVLQLLLNVIAAVFSFGSASQAYLHWNTNTEVFELSSRLASVTTLLLFGKDESIQHFLVKES